ncbi:uncharacterized protein [Miscanthus floridulus]|uniref:uncharacterized protein n=1 Tax=Miscanthus floridulus TaxID=154761 RepID=UPI003459D851
MAYLFSTAIANPFDLNVRVEEDNDGNLPFDLNEAILEDHTTYGFDLNLPLDEFGAVDFDYLQNLPEHAVEAPVEEQVEEPHRRKEMFEELRKQVYQALLARSNNGKLGKKDTAFVAAQFGLHIRSVQRLWKRGKIQLANSVPVVVSSLKKGKVGRKTIPVDLEALRNIPLKERMTIEDVCMKLNMSKWKIQKYLKKGLLRRHSSSIKPYLTEANKRSRLKWCVDMIKKDLLDDPRFKDLFDFVFIDEKWFYLSQKSEKYYLLPEEDDPHRTSIQYKKNAKTIEALVPTVQEAFLEYSAHKANRMFVTLQSVLMEAMKVKGCNKFKIPHMKKETLEREDRLPSSIPCNPSLLDEAEATLAA